MALTTVEVPACTVDLIGATALHQLVLDLHQFEPCCWCGGAPQTFMSPAQTIFAAQHLFCALCGRSTLQQIDGRIIPALLPIWCKDQHPLHDVVVRLLQSIEADLPDNLNRWGTYLMTRLSVHTGMTQSVEITLRPPQEPKRVITVYPWTFFGALQQAINQVVLPTLSDVPHFDLSSREACPTCYAGSDHQVMRNFDPVSRDGDIHCDRCGRYIRMWNP